jgi:hypothetical protein
VKFQTEQLYKTSDTICESCIVSKQIQIIHYDIMWSIIQKLEQVHTDLWNHMIHHSSKTVHTSQYWSTITHKVMSTVLKTKNQFFNRFKSDYIKYKMSLKWNLYECVLMKKRVCKLNHDRLYNWSQTTFKYTVSYTSEHNSIAEWCWKTLCTMKNIMLLNVKLFNRFWIKIMNTVNYLRNRLSTYVRNHYSEKVWTELIFSLSHVRIFEFLLYVHISKKKWSSQI